jgi:hypothetical protein
MKRIIISMPNFIGDSINTISVIDFTKKIEKKIVLAENDVYLHINKRTFIDSI